jgi:hypothetical protein
MLAFVIGLALVASPHGPPGPHCPRDTLRAVVRQRSAAMPYALVTAGGRRLQVYGQDFVDPRAWRAGDALALCADSDGTALGAALRVRDLRRGEELVTTTDRPAQERDRPDPPLQILDGPGFQALLTAVAARCPASRVRYATPAALLGAEETFEERLGAAERHRLAAAAPRAPDGGYAACAGRDGASCPANQAMDALVHARLMRRFTDDVCTHGSASWH